MVIKLIIALLLCCSSAFATPSQIRQVVGMAKNAATCNPTAFFTSPSDNTSYWNLGSSADYAYAGGVWTGATFTLCKVGISARVWVTPPILVNMVASVYTRSGTSLGTLKGTSTAVAPAAFSATFQRVYFTFSAPVEVTNGDAIVISSVTPGTTMSPWLRVSLVAASDTELDSAAYRAALTQSALTDGATPDFELFKYE